LYPDFGNEPTNLRLGLASDEMNPFGNLTTNHNSWRILLMIYNLPPWLCMKRKYIMLFMMIAGPRQPRNDIDVYLTLLIKDLTKLWEDGVCGMGISNIPLGCVLWFSVPLMTIQHMAT